MLLRTIALTALLTCSSVYASGLDLIGKVAEDKVEMAANANSTEVKTETTNHNPQSFDIAKLPKNLQALFTGVGKIELSQIDALETALQEQMPNETAFIDRVLSKTREYTNKGRWLQARCRIRALAIKSKATNLAEDVIEEKKETYKSKASGYEIPIPLSPLTFKYGQPNSEIYLLNSKFYEKGQPLEGKEPVLANSNGLATSGVIAASAVCPFVAGVTGGVATGKGVERITSTISAPLFARHYAKKRLGLTDQRFDEVFEEEVIKDYQIPGTNAAYRATYQLRNKLTGEVIYQSSFDALDVIAVAGALAKACNGLKESWNKEQIKVVNIGGPLEGKVSQRSLRSDYVNVAMEEGPNTIVANINKVDLKGKVGTNVRLLKASNVPFEEVPTGKWVDPETFIRQAKSIGAKNIIVKTGTDCIELMESTLKKAGYVVKTVKRSGLSIITAKAR